MKFSTAGVKKPYQIVIMCGWFIRDQSLATVLNCESETSLSRCEPALLTVIYVLHPWYTRNSRMCLLKFFADSIGQQSVDIFLVLSG